MSKHQASDGESMTSEPPNVDDSTTGDSVDCLREDAVDDEASSGSAEGDKIPSTRKTPSRKQLLLTLVFVLIVGQWMIYKALKHHLVPDNIIPQLQEQFINFNETPLWTFFNNSHSQSNTYLTQESKRPGFQLASEGAQGKYPVVMIPGFVTSGLEMWKGKDCAKKYFRTRLWGGVGSAQQWLVDRYCAIEHLTLDPHTGKDPEGIRIRAAQGFEAADYFLGNYWVWGKILESLADVGYDGSFMSMESYDWRLSFPKLEERDGFFTKLKYKIESFHKFSGKKVVLTSHSLGVLLVHYFFAFVSEEDPDWVDNHIHAYVNIAGAHLGVPKAASALLSGEMSDTIFMGIAGSLIEQFIGRKVRCELWRSWGSLWHMLPKGRDSFWGNIMTMTDGNGNVEDYDWDALDNRTPMNKAVEKFGAFGQHPSSRIIGFLSRLGGGYQAETAKTAWHDASRTPLPKAPNMKIYCLYGVGIETERAYYYKRNQEDQPEDEDTDPSAEVPFVVDTSVDDAENKIIHGIEYGDGDGSVPLESLGYLCSDGWRQRKTKLNPARIPIVTREYQHREEFTVDDPMRSGPHSGDHVDILGHSDVLIDLVRIVTDHEVDEVQDNIISNIKELASDINERGGVRRRGRLQGAWKRWKARVQKSQAQKKAGKVMNRSAEGNQAHSCKAVNESAEADSTHSILDNSKDVPACNAT